MNAATPRARPPARITARGLALFLGVFLSGNALHATRTGALDPTRTFIPWFAWIPSALATVLGGALGVLLFLWALRPAARRPRRRATRALLLVHMPPVVAELLRDMTDLWQGRVAFAIVPASLVVLVSLTFLAGNVGRTAPADPIQRARIALTAFLLALLHPLFLVQAHGMREAPVRADLAVVFGSRVYADGTCSTSVGDRVRRAAQLYRDGAVARLLMSGGPGDGPVHETEGMQRFAASLGVPADRIVLDRDGTDTRATVANALAIGERLGASTLVAVSHAYHLPRIELEFARHGWRVATAPAIESRPLRSMPFFVAREIPAYWYYWLTWQL